MNPTAADPRSRGALVAVLRNAGALFDGDRVHCGWHLDLTGVGKIEQGRDGVWRFGCPVCGAAGTAAELEERHRRENSRDPFALAVAAASGKARCLGASSQPATRPTTPIRPPAPARLDAQTGPTTLPTSDLADEVRSIASGRIVNLPMPWPLLEELGQMFTPGGKIVLAAPGGASKSLWVLQLLAHWGDVGIRAACLELERDRTFHLRRVLAQRTGVADVTKCGWVKTHADVVHRMIRKHSEHLNAMGLAIHVAPRTFTTLDAADWIADRAGEGCRATVIDPITCLHRPADYWVSDDKFLGACDKIATESGLSLLCVTHPRKGSGSCPDLDSLAGGAAWARFADSVIWLEAHDLREATVRACCGSDTVMHNRTLHLLKTRSGEGTGLRLAFQFDASKGLILRELGVIASKKRKDRASL